MRATGIYLCFSTSQSSSAKLDDRSPEYHWTYLDAFCKTMLTRISSFTII